MALPRDIVGRYDECMNYATCKQYKKTETQLCFYCVRDIKIEKSFEFEQLCREKAEGSTPKNCNDVTSSYSQQEDACRHCGSVTVGPSGLCIYCFDVCGNCNEEMKSVFTQLCKKCLSALPLVTKPFETPPNQSLYYAATPSTPVRCEQQLVRTFKCRSLLNDSK